MNVKYPIKDFKDIKAYKNATHCEEIELFSKMALDSKFTGRDVK